MNNRILSYLLAFIFLASGGAKLLSLPFEIAAFERWGYAIEFMYFTGVVECLGAVGLLFSRFSSFASLCLSALMLGAIGTHIIHREWVMLAVAIVIALAAFWRGWSGRADIKQSLITLGYNK